MRVIGQSAISEAGLPAHDERQTAVEGRRRNIAASALMGWTGLAAMAAGAIFAGIQPIHPPDVLASVTTTSWAIITTIKFAMCFFFLLGVAGLHVRQVERSGRLGLMGYLVFSLSWVFQSGFVFAEAFILPVLSTAAPQFVDSYLGVVNGHPGTMNIGALPAIYDILVGIPYVLGGVLFGVATFRARVLPRGPAALLAVVALLTPAAALLPHAIQRMAAGIPMGIAMVSLGYVLWSERRTRTELTAAPVERCPRSTKQ